MKTTLFIDKNEFIQILVIFTLLEKSRAGLTNGAWWLKLPNELMSGDLGGLLTRHTFLAQQSPDIGRD